MARPAKPFRLVDPRVEKDAPPPILLWLDFSETNVLLRAQHSADASAAQNIASIAVVDDKLVLKLIPIARSQIGLYAALGNRVVIEVDYTMCDTADAEVSA